MMNNMNNELNRSFAELLACDMANEIIDLCKDDKCSDKYDQKVFELLKNGDDHVFYLSDLIDRYVQSDKSKAERQEKYYSYLLYLDDLPVCIINTDITDEKWDYTSYVINDERCVRIIDSGRFYMLNADDYGLYLVGDDDYFVLSYPIEENKDFLNQSKKLGIELSTIDKHILDLNLIEKTDIDVNITEYTDEVNETCLNAIKDYLKENEEDLCDGKMIGPVLRYQYFFSSLNNIEVCDYNKENGSLTFRLLKDGRSITELYYDSFEESVEVYVDEESCVDTDSYFVHLADVGYVYGDKTIAQGTENGSYSAIDKLVTKKIQNRIKAAEPSFKVFDLNK